MFDAIKYPVWTEEHPKHSFLRCVSQEVLNDLLRMVEFAKDHGIYDQLHQQLAWLAGYAGGEYCGVSVVLYPDFAFMSLGFNISKSGVHWFTGGLIYDGPGAPCDGSFPQLTVSIGEHDKKGTWSCHT